MGHRLAEKASLDRKEIKYLTPPEITGFIYMITNSETSTELLLVNKQAIPPNS